MLRCYEFRKEMDSGGFNPEKFDEWKVEYADRLIVNDSFDIVTPLFKKTKCEDFKRAVESGGVIGAFTVKNGKGAFKKWGVNWRKLLRNGGKLVASMDDPETQVDHWLCGKRADRSIDPERYLSNQPSDEILIPRLKDDEVNGIYGHSIADIMWVMEEVDADPTKDCIILLARKSRKKLERDIEELKSRIIDVMERGGDVLREERAI